MSKVTNCENIQAWDKNSNHVIEKFTDEGDFYRQHVINPAFFSLLGNIKGKVILDAGCGQGYLSRLLAKRGAKVTGLESAKGLISYAIQKEKQEKLGIKYIQADLSNQKKEQNFYDIILSNMVFMDIPDWKSAMKNCIKTLKPKGFFIFSISHPCFDEEQQKKPFVEIKNYFTKYQMKKPIGYSFHRTLSDYINFLIQEGCCLKKILEPQLPLEIIKKTKNHKEDKHHPNFLFVKAVKDQ